jgi:hypothetical protein
MDGEECVGAIVCKLDRYKDANRGYIAMLDVDDKYRRRGIGKQFRSGAFLTCLKIENEIPFYYLGSNLVETAIKRMIQHNADEVIFLLLI